MKKKIILVFFILLFLNIEIALAEENEYGIVRAWFNGQNATIQTIEGVKLKIGEPVEIKIEIISKINGNVYLKLSEPGVTKSYDLISGNSGLDESIDNSDIDTGWSKTYLWTLKPNGAWVNGNAPLNIRVSFSRKGNQKPIQFTIANPYILDEQYAGAPVSTTDAPEITDTGADAKAVPFISVIFAICVLVIMGSLGKRH